MLFGHEEIAIWLIERGADVNIVAQNRQRIAPIHAAAANGSLPLLRLLLANGADVNAKQQNDFTPLHTAADNNDADMVHLLLEHGASVDAVTKDGRTPREIALKKAYRTVAGLLE